MSINITVFSGNLTKDPEVRTSDSGTAVMSFSVAINESRKNHTTGEWETVPSFIDCTVFGNRADGLSKVLAKGSKVVVSGRLHQSSWEKDGVKRSKIGVIVDNVDFFSSRASDGAADAGVAEAQVYEDTDIVF